MDAALAEMYEKEKGKTKFKMKKSLPRTIPKALRDEPNEFGPDEPVKMNPWEKLKEKFGQDK